MSIGMSKNVEFAKVVTFLAVFMTAIGPLACYAKSLPESTNPGITLRTDAPIYTGPVQEGDLEELTVEDYEEFGVEPEVPEDQYRQYLKVLEQPAPGIQVPYKMRIVDRDLAVEDFYGFNVPEELSEARYNEYLSMNPVTVDGRTIHYVFVYHRPLASTEAEDSAI